MVTPVSLAALLKNCTHLEVLKLAGIPNWVLTNSHFSHFLVSLTTISAQTEATVSKLWIGLDLPNQPDFRLPSLKTLKLRQTAVNDTIINQCLIICPNIRRLDLSFTNVRHPPPLLGNQLLEKLSLTSTKVSTPDLVRILTNLQGLKSLALGALGASGGLSATIANSSSTLR